jgi:hypothetical protein
MAITTIITATTIIVITATTIITAGITIIIAGTIVIDNDGTKNTIAFGLGRSERRPLFFGGVGEAAGETSEGVPIESRLAR